MSDILRPLIKNLGNKNLILNFESSVTQYWLCNVNGDSYYLCWHGNGWTVRFQESYMGSNGTFNHKNDIKSFDFSNFGDDWDFVFKTKEDAIAVFSKKHELKGIEV